MCTAITKSVYDMQVTNKKTLLQHLTINCNNDSRQVRIEVWTDLRMAWIGYQLKDIQAQCTDNTSY